MFSKSGTKAQSCPSWDEAGVSAFVDAIPVRIVWDEITAIYAYKKDCLLVDQIRLIVACKEWNIEFTEDDADFVGLRRCITDRMRIRKDWYEVLVLSPAFKTTWTVVYPTNESAEIEVSQ
jgi:hypothetical protein